MNYMIKVGSQNGDLGVTFKLDDGVFNAGYSKFLEMYGFTRDGYAQFLGDMFIEEMKRVLKD
jgi:hypothetical protein